MIKIELQKLFVSALIVGVFLYYFSPTQEIQRRLLNEDENKNHTSGVYTPDDWRFWFCLTIALCLVILAAVCSGMTVGYLSLDELKLEVKLSDGTPDEKRQAQIILPLLYKHHLLLCTLLVANAFCMEALPIFFNRVVPPALAVFISVLFIVFAGEIVPQALCTGPKQLQIAEYLTPYIKIIILIFYPISFPLSRILDKIFGEHIIVRFQKNELKALIELHEIKKQEIHDVHDHGQKNTGFTQEEIQMLTSTLDLRDKTIVSAMVSLKQIVMFNVQTILTTEIFDKVSNSGFSNVILYEVQKSNIKWVIKTKQLLSSKLIGKQLGTIEKKQSPLVVSSDTNLLDMLMIFKQTKTKLAFIDEKPAEYQSGKNRISQIFEYGKRNPSIIGLISLKDIFEVMVKKELQDQDFHVPIYSMVKKKILKYNYQFKPNQIVNSPIIKFNMQEQDEMKEK